MLVLFSFITKIRTDPTGDQVFYNKSLTFDQSGVGLSVKGDSMNNQITEGYKILIYNFVWITNRSMLLL